MADAFHGEWAEPELESLASLSENLVYRITGCEETLVRKTLQEVAREFVAETQCLTSRQCVTPDDGGMCYPVARFGGVVGSVREVWKHGRRLERGRDWTYPVGSGFKISERLIPRRPDADHPSERLNPIRYTPRTVVIGSQAESDDRTDRSPFSAVVVEHLPMFFEGLPEDFLQRYGDAICSGVMARLCSMQGRAWTDPQVAADERVRYDNFKSETRMKMETPAGGRFIDTSMVL